MMKNSTDTTTEVLSSEDKEMVSMDSEGRSVNSSRRRLAKFVVGTPILVTLASRPVLAAGCLSNMMSGNLSDPNRGQCSKGWSPGGWGQPGGKVSGYGTKEAWTRSGLNYDTSTLNDVPAELNSTGLPGNTLLSVILTTPKVSAHKEPRHFICAYLNASLSEATTPVFTYILRKDQVIDLIKGSISYPSTYSSLKEFLDGTWSKIE